MEPPADLEDEFHDWYDTEHVPVRLRLPGFGGAVRYEVVGPGTRFLVCYFIDDLAVLGTDDYARLKRRPGERTERMLGSVRGFTRYTCELVAGTAPALPTEISLVHALRAADDASADVESAYSASMAALDERRWRSSRLYRPFGASVGEPWTHLAIHEIDLAAAVGEVLPDVPAELRPEGVEHDRWWSYRAFRRFGIVTSV
jgi:hypothetical protein